MVMAFSKLKAAERKTNNWGDGSGSVLQPLPSLNPLLQEAIPNGCTQFVVRREWVW